MSKELIGLDTGVAFKALVPTNVFSSFISHFGCSCCFRAALPFNPLIVAVASRQHSHSFIGRRCCFRAPLPSQIPSLAVASRQQSWFNSTFHSSIQALVLSTVPSLESLQTPWNTALRDLLVPVLYWYPAVRTLAVFYQGKKVTCFLQLISLQGIWVGCLDYAFGKPATKDSSTLYYIKQVPISLQFSKACVGNNWFWYLISN